MWLRIKRILSSKTIMLRLAFTFFVLLLFKISTHITVPLYDVSAIQELMKRTSGFFAILNNFSGRAMQRFSIFALGITPYITASIIIQLLQSVVPAVKEIAEQGEAGRVKLNRITRIIAVILAFIQGLALILGASTGKGNNFVNSVSGNYAGISLYMALVIAAGTAITIFIADLITIKGIGNGTSLMIAAGIVTSIPIMFSTMWKKYITYNKSGWDYVWFIVITLLYFIILFGIVFMEGARRKIPTQYANRKGKASANIPLKINTASVIPVIFASTLLSIPLTVVGFTGGGSASGAGYWLNQIFSYQKPIGFVLYIVLIVLFTFFYAFLTVDPNKIADNLSKSNAYIPGVRPGEDTKNYIAKLLFKITVIGATYLACLAAIPVLTSVAFGLKGQEAQAITLGGTSLLIVVGVAIETANQMETKAEQQTYKGIF